jgi:alpha-tubulin suppressor-like RCC1 family protein
MSNIKISQLSEQTDINLLKTAGTLLEISREADGSRISESVDFNTITSIIDDTVDGALATIGDEVSTVTTTERLAITLTDGEGVVVLDTGASQLYFGAGVNGSTLWIPIASGTADDVEQDLDGLSFSPVAANASVISSPNSITEWTGTHSVNGSTIGPIPPNATHVSVNMTFDAEIDFTASGGEATASLYAGEYLVSNASLIDNKYKIGDLDAGGTNSKNTSPNRQISKTVVIAVNSNDISNIKWVAPAIVAVGGSSVATSTNRSLTISVLGYYISETAKVIQGSSIPLAGRTFIPSSSPQTALAISNITEDPLDTSLGEHVIFDGVDIETTTAEGIPAGATHAVFKITSTANFEIAGSGTPLQQIIEIYLSSYDIDPNNIITDRNRVAYLETSMDEFSPHDVNSETTAMVLVDVTSASQISFALKAQNIKLAGMAWTSTAEIQGYYVRENAALEGSIIIAGNSVKSIVTSTKGSPFVLLNDGNIYMGGRNAKEVDGHGPNAPTFSRDWLPLALTNMVEIVAGDNHVLAVDADNRLWKCGSNNKGQLGTGDTTTLNRYIVETDPLILASPIRKIAAFNNASYVLLESGELYACGKNVNRKFGDYNGVSPANDASIKVWTLISSNVIDVWPSVYQTVIKKTGNVLQGAGHNTYQQFGSIAPPISKQLTWVDVVLPVVGTPEDIIEVVYTGRVIIYLSASGRVYTAGQADGSRNFGTSTSTINWPTLTEIGPAGVVISDIKGADTDLTGQDLGQLSAFALSSTGVLYGTGNNSEYQLGNGTTTDINSWHIITDSPVFKGRAVTHMGQGGGAAIFVVDSVGVLYSWGIGTDGQHANSRQSDVQYPTVSTANQDLLLTSQQIAGGGVPGRDGAQGPRGYDVDDVQRTSGNGDPGTIDTYTMYDTTGSVIGPFNVTNGADGATGGGTVFITSSGNTGNNYWRFWSDGTKDMWGTTAVLGGNGVTSIALPASFSNTLFNVTATQIRSGALTGAVAIYVSATAVSTFDLTLDGHDNNSGCAVHWRASGA